MEPTRVTTIDFLKCVKIHVPAQLPYFLRLTLIPNIGSMYSLNISNLNRNSDKPYLMRNTDPSNFHNIVNSLWKLLQVTVTDDIILKNKNNCRQIVNNQQKLNTSSITKDIVRVKHNTTSYLHASSYSK